MANRRADTTAAHSTLEPTNFAVYSGREDEQIQEQQKSHTVESVAVNPADKQQIIITLNDSTPVEEDSIIEIEYEYPGLSDANGRLITLDGRDVPTFQLNFGGDNGGGNDTIAPAIDQAQKPLSILMDKQFLKFTESISQSSLERALDNSDFTLFVDGEELSKQLLLS